MVSKTVDQFSDRPDLSPENAAHDGCLSVGSEGGVTLCARALNQYTEVLPLISMNELFELPPSEDCHPALGTNTQAAIMSGVFWGQIGAVRELINRLSNHERSNGDNETAPKILLTGGGARLLVPYFANARHCPYLPLQGLVLAAANSPRS